MSAQQIADDADMIVIGYAYKVRNGYLEVTDLSDINKISKIQDSIITESLMTDEEDAIVLKYYMRNKDVLEESLCTD